MESKYITDMVRSLFTLAFAISTMYMLLDCKESSKKKKNNLYIYFVLLLILDGITFWKLGYTEFMKLYPFIVQFPVFLGFVYTSKFNLIKVFFIHLTMVAIALSSALIGVIIVYYTGVDRGIVNLICAFMYIPLWLAIRLKLKTQFLYMLNNTEKGWVGLCIIPMTYTVIIYMASKYDLNYVITSEALQSVALILALTLAAYILILRMFRQTREQLRLLNDQNLLQLQVSAARSHLETLKEDQDKTKIYRHDMRHHLNLINSYLMEDKAEAAQSYITEIEKNIMETEAEVYCKNYSLNLIFYHYITKMKEEGVAVAWEINIPEKVPVLDMDLCVVFSNALENSMLALNKMRSRTGKIVKIICKTQNDKLLIQIVNSYEGTIHFADGLPISEEGNRGLGVKSIVAVVEKYLGVYSFNVENGTFITSIIF